MIKTKCPKCQGSLKVPDEAIGKRGRCPACRHSFIVQEPTEEAPLAKTNGLEPESSLPAAEPGLPENEFGLEPLATPQSSAEGAFPDIEAAAAWPAAQPAPTTGSVKRQKKDHSARRPPNRQRWMIAGGGVLAASLLIIGLIWGFSGRGGDTSAGGNASDGGNSATPIDVDTSKYAVIETPPAAAAGVPSTQVAFVPKAAARPAKLQQPRATSSESSSSASPLLWNIEPDTATAVEPLAADLDVPLVGTIATWGAVRPPLLASLGQPYAMTAPRWNANPYENRTDKKGKPVVAEPQPNSPVIDLRTGQTAGEFTYWANFALRGSRLGPDATYLLTPDAEPLDNSTAKEGLLLIWKQDERRPVAKLQMPGQVTWLDFVAPNRLAMLSLKPKQVLQIWDVSQGELIHTVEFENGQFTLSRGVDEKFFLDDTVTVGAVSPGGRYVALGGAKGVAFVSTADGKQIGLIPISTAGIRYHTMSFSPDGGRLYVLAAYRHPSAGQFTVNLNVCDVATGGTLHSLRLLDEQTSANSLQGYLLPGPIEETILHGRLFDERYLECRSRVIETQSGSYMFTLPYIAMRAAGPNRLLAISNDGEKKLKLHTVPGDSDSMAAPSDALQVQPGLAQSRERPEIQALKAQKMGARQPGAAGLRGVAPRPPVLKADRTMVQSTKPQPPGTWSPLPATPHGWAASNESVSLDVFPAAIAGGKALVLTYSFVVEPQGRHELYAQLFDLAGGQAVGTSFLLWPWIAPPDKPRTNTPPDLPSNPPLAALSADAKKLAVRDPANLGRVDAWTETGTRIGGIQPLEGAIDWLGWSSSGKLLTLGDGKFSAWDIATGKALYEIEGDYAGQAALCPGGAWVALAAGDALDLIDADTGKSLGRCKPTTAGGAITALAVAPDGKTVAAARPGSSPLMPLGPPPQTQECFLADLWDMTTGKANAVLFGGAQMAHFEWSTPEQLLALTGTPLKTPGSRPEFIIKIELLDRRGTILCQYKLARLFPHFDTGWPALATSPDSRIWVNKDNKWKGRKLPNPAESSGGEFVDATAQLLRIEVNVGNRGASQALAQALAGEMPQKGFRLGPKGWALRVEHQVEDSGQTLSSGDPRNGSPIPQVRFTWRLLDTEGAILWEDDTLGRFVGEGSKYHVKRSLEAGRVVHSYDFKGDMRTAIVEEILETQGPTQSPPNSLPRGTLLRTASGFRPLPATAELSIE